MISEETKAETAAEEVMEPAAPEVAQRTGEMIFKMGELLITLVNNAQESKDGQASGLIAGKNGHQFAVLVLKQHGQLSEKQIKLLNEKAKSVKISEVGVRMKNVKVDKKRGGKKN